MNSRSWSLPRQSTGRKCLVVLALAQLWSTGVRGQLSDAYPHFVRVESVAPVYPVQPGPSNRTNHYFKLVQVVTAPTLTGPVRLPVCIKTSKINKLLAESINEQYRDHVQGNAVVETSYIQQVNRCTYSSYISYNGDKELARRLVHSANTNTLCKSLQKYCSELFGAEGGYTLSATTGDKHPPLPPALDFRCIKSTYSQRLDHFSDSETRMFGQVYWVCDDAWPTRHSTQVHEGHIIVFLGNEGALGVPKQPIVFENARRLKALVLLVEHRYYGESMPYPKPSNSQQLPTEQYQWLTIEQVIEDTSTILAYVRQQHRVPTNVPAMVIGGSYGGMLASYHRVVKPHTFSAAIASSAPNNYIIGTHPWAKTSNLYHEHLAYSFLYHSGGPTCGDLVRQGFNSMWDLSKTQDGRRELAKMFRVCEGDRRLGTDEDGFSFYMQQYDDIVAGAVQVNNQPSLLGKVSLTCNLIQDAITHLNQTPLEALAMVSIYFNSNSSAEWCSDFDPKYYLIDKNLPSYSYQCCTQGTVYSSELPASGSPGTLTAAYNVTEAGLRRQCEAMFGKQLPNLNPPKFAVEVKELVRKYGGIVFTNGDTDGWSGGSYYSESELRSPAPAGGLPTSGRLFSSPSEGAAKVVSSIDLSRARSSQTPGGGVTQSRDSRVAFVVYEGASHCTDTHTFNWDNPVEPRSYRSQRARAMDHAARFMQRGGYTGQDVSLNPS